MIIENVPCEEGQPDMLLLAPTYSRRRFTGSTGFYEKMGSKQLPLLFTICSTS